MINNNYLSSLLTVNKLFIKIISIEATQKIGRKNP